MTDDQIDEIVKSKKFFQTELIDDNDGDNNRDDINDDDDIRHDFPRFDLMTTEPTNGKILPSKPGTGHDQNHGKIPNLGTLLGTQIAF